MWLRAHGAKRIPAVGDPFDLRHERSRVVVTDRHGTLVAKMEPSELHHA